MPTLSLIMVLIFMLVACGLLLLLILRLWDIYRDQREWRYLLATQPLSPLNYDASMVADLPEPVRRFFNYVIMPGTRLKTVAEIKMTGEFGLGNTDKSKYRRMAARQILAAPAGFVWQVNMPGVVPVSGSDSASWTRFRILGLIPVARLGGGADHAKSAFGRYVAEAVFWSPAALLPGPGIKWEAVDPETVRVTVTHKSLSQAVDITLDTDGCPGIIRFMRWSNANPEKKHRLQPFGGRLSDFRETDGFRVPFHVEAGNMFGTEDEFIFFKATVNSINYPDFPERAIINMNYNGSCQCGEVRYKVEGAVAGFFLCHCRYCQKDTGSAHAANLFVPQGKLSWVSGSHVVKTYRVPNTRHQKSFCTQCGSALPNEQPEDDVIVIPAGSLDGDFAIRPNAHLFSASRAPWDHNLEELRVFDQLPL